MEVSFLSVTFAVTFPILSFSLENCHSNFSQECFCGYADYFDRSNQFIVNCTNTGFTDAKVLAHLPETTQVLIFSGNNISKLPWNILGVSSNHSELKVLDFSNNGIVEIRGKSFHHVPNVERLILNHNQISLDVIEPNNHHHHPRVFSNFDSLKELHLTDAFKDNAAPKLASDLHDIFLNSELIHLTKLHLEQNEIFSFKDPQVFCGLPSLMDLHLGNNYLESINFNISCLKNLRFLDLEQNRILKLTKHDFDLLDSFPKPNKSFEIDLSGNPLKCGYELESLCAWFRRTSVEIRNFNATKCTNSNSINTDKSLNMRETDCITRYYLPSSQRESEPHMFITFILTALTVVLLSLVCLLLYVNREQINYQFRPIIDSISRKVQYTSIGKQEEHEMVL